MRSATCLLSALGLVALGTVGAQRATADDRLYTVGIDFEIDGAPLQVGIPLHVGQSVPDAVQQWCNSSGVYDTENGSINLCAGGSPEVVDQIVATVEGIRNEYRERLYPNPLLLEILEAKVVHDGAGAPVSLDSNVAADEGRYLYDLIVRNNMSRTLEVGMAYGISAVYMAQAHRDLGRVERTADCFHLSVDPFQSTQWRGIGTLNLKRAGLGALCKLIERESFIALPALVDASVSRPYDLIFIDGMHLFDFTLLDFFYADLMLAEGGYIVFDDAHMPSVKKVISYVLTNRAYERVENGLNSRVQTVRKLKNDDRRWDFHSSF